MLKLANRFFGSGLCFVWLAGLVILLDRFTKVWVAQHLTLFQPYPITSFFNLTLAYNRGAAFSFLHSASGWQNALLGSFALIVCIIVLTWLWQLSRKQYWMNTALCFILGGAIGNAIDRVQQGYVTDFLDFHWHEWHFAIFNVADSAISIGAVMVLLHWLFYKQ